MPTLGQDLLDNLRVEDLGQVLADERELLGCVCGRHGGLLAVSITQYKSQCLWCWVMRCRGSRFEVRCAAISIRDDYPKWW